MQVPKMQEEGRQASLELAGKGTFESPTSPEARLENTVRINARNIPYLCVSPIGLDLDY
jgi:hypothetical protein